jgi:hypothetical protein
MEKKIVRDEKLSSNLWIRSGEGVINQGPRANGSNAEGACQPTGSIAAGTYSPNF